jgi:hypothetical protein
LSRNLGASTSWKPKGLSRPVMGLKKERHTCGEIDCGLGYIHGVNFSGDFKQTKCRFSLFFEIIFRPSFENVLRRVFNNEEK